MKLRFVVRTNSRILALAGSCLFAISLPAFAQQGFDVAPSAYPPSAQQPMQQPPQQAGYPQGQQFPQQQPPAYPQGGMPAPAGYPQQQPSAQPAGHGTPGNAGSGAQAHPMQALLQAEMQDFGVAPQQQLQTQFHGPTPTSIPGGQVITTDRLLGLYQQGQQNGLLVFHVLGQGPTLPNAQNAGPASQPGSFDDQTQQEFGQYLQQVTQGNKGRPMVFYCLNTQCWMSYNAALRAINMGFTQVYWYRGGIEAWQQAQQLAGQQGQITTVNAGPDTREIYD